MGYRNLLSNKQRVVAKPTEIIPQTSEEIAPKPKVEKEIPSEF